MEIFIFRICWNRTLAGLLELFSPWNWINIKACAEFVNKSCMSKYLICLKENAFCIRLPLSFPWTCTVVLYRDQTYSLYSNYKLYTDIFYTDIFYADILYTDTFYTDILYTDILYTLYSLYGIFFILLFFILIFFILIFFIRYILYTHIFYTDKKNLWKLKLQ